MFEPTYRQAVRFATTIVANNRLVWLLGLLSIGVGQFGMSDFLAQVMTLTSPAAMTWPHFVFPYFSPGALAWFIWLLVLLLPILAVMIFVSVAAQGALIAHVIDLFRHRHDNIEQAWHKGVRHFWRLLGVAILKKIALGILFLAMGLVITPWVGATTLGASIIRALLVVISFFVALYITSVAIYAGGYVVQDGVTLGVALRRGSALWSNHILVSLELSFLSVAANIVVIFIILSGLNILTAIPTVLFALLGSLVHAGFLVVIGVYISSNLAYAIVALLAALCNALITSAWMYLFMKMHHEGVLSRSRAFIRHAFSLIDAWF